MKKIFAGVAVAMFAIFAVPTAASAHTPEITVSCEGVVLHATNYDGNVANNWSVTIGDAFESGTFGNSLDKSFPVPQDGKTTQVSVKITDDKNTPEYTKVFEGPVGPCGETPVPEKPANIPWGDSSANLPDCDKGFVTDTVKEGYYDHTLVNNVWVKNEKPTITKNETKTRAVTAEECPVKETPKPTPTVDKPKPTETPAVVGPNDSEPTAEGGEDLAVTGPVSGWLIPFAAAFLALGSLAVVRSRKLAHA